MKLLCKNENGIIYVENDEGEIFGIVDVMTVIDVDGLPYPQNPLEVLESNGFFIQQDWDNEMSYIEFREDNGETIKLCFSDMSVTLE